MAVNEPLILIR